MNRLRARLETTRAFAGAAARSRPFSAHMTVAEFISARRTRKLTEELENVVPRGEFLCDHVSFALPDRRFRFAEARRLDLAR